MRPTGAGDLPSCTWHRDEVGGHTVAARSWIQSGQRRGRPIVLVHGLVVASGLTTPLGRVLADRYDVWAPDLPGFGRSSKPSPALDVRGLGGALAAWLDVRGLRDVVLVGSSFGCQIAVETVLRRRDLAARLVLLAPTIDPALRTVPRQLRRWRQEQKTQSLTLKALQVRDYARAGIPRAIATFRHALADRIEDKLPLLEQPALVTRGTRDPIVEQRWAEQVTELLPDGRLAVLAGAAHASAYEQPEQTARVIHRFLNEE
jgi:2-hydroxy-6-oxonona-2,4-dienedioate hydrolase